MRDRMRSDVERYKKQAARLRQFLAAGGIEIKNTHALEAIAKVHDAPDWHTLSHAKPDERQEEEAPAADYKYAVVTAYCGFSEVTLAPSRELALRTFLQEARMFIDLFGARNEVLIVGQDADGSMPALCLTIDGDVVVALQQPSKVIGMNVVPDGQGKGVLVPAKMHDLLGLDNTESFYLAGVALTAAFATRPAAEEQPRATAAMNSLVAMLLDIDYNEAVLELAAESQDMESAPLQIDPRELLKAVDKIQLMRTRVVTVELED